MVVVAVVLLLVLLLLLVVVAVVVVEKLQTADVDVNGYREADGDLAPSRLRAAGLMVRRVGRMTPWVVLLILADAAVDADENESDGERDCEGKLRGQRSTAVAARRRSMGDAAEKSAPHQDERR